MIGGGALVFREINKKDFGILTPSRDERYRNVMECCYQPELLFEEARLFNEYGLKTQSAMLKRRGEWRARTPHVKQAHEDIYQKALQSENIPAILQVAMAFEGWTATKKAANLRERARTLQTKMIQESARKAVESMASHKQPESKGNNGSSSDHEGDIPRNNEEATVTIEDDV